MSEVGSSGLTEGDIGRRAGIAATLGLNRGCHFDGERLVPLRDGKSAYPIAKKVIEGKYGGRRGEG
jgi:hypothetical protein